MDVKIQNLKARIKSFFVDFKTFLKDTFYLFKQNFDEVFLFVFICATFSLLGTALSKSILIRLLMYFNQVTYIAPINLLSILESRMTLILVLIFMIAMTFISLFEIAGLLHAFSMGQIGRSTNISSMCLAGIRACKKAVYPKNWLIMLFLSVLFPLTKVLPLSSSVFKLIIPGFVLQTIEYTKSFAYLYRIAYTIILSIVLTYIFAINIFILQDYDFNDSMKQSHILQKGKYLKTFFTMIFLTVIMNFVINSVASIIVINFRELISFFSKTTGIVTKSADLGTYTYALRQIIKSLILPAVNNAALTVMFYKYIDEKQLISTISAHTFKAIQPSREQKGLIVAILLFILSINTYYLMSKYEFLQEPVDKPIVCAHRGDNVNAPENTMPAFELAAYENLSWIELDVHQTLDGIIVCNHDSDIKRTTGVDLTIHDNTLQELQKHVFGDWMPGDYENVVIPTLEEALTLAKKEGMHVQVELKGHPDDKDFEANVLKVINDTGMHDQVMIIAQDYSRLEKINELDPSIVKGYCMAIALGRLEDIECTDNVTIEESNITPELVKRLHSKGIKVFCWTVDDESTIQYLVSCDVDVIGTDNPMMVANALDKVDYSGGFVRGFNIVMHAVADMDK